MEPLQLTSTIENQAIEDTERDRGKSFITNLPLKTNREFLSVAKQRKFLCLKSEQRNLL